MNGVAFRKPPPTLHAKKCRLLFAKDSKRIPQREQLKGSNGIKKCLPSTHCNNRAISGAYITTDCQSAWYECLRDPFKGGRYFAMMYPFLQIDNDTEIVHSEMQANGEVKVYIEKPDEMDGFHHATCFLPNYRWEDISGFSDAEIKRFHEVIESTAHLIIEFSQRGGFGNTSDF